MGGRALQAREQHVQSPGGERAGACEEPHQGQERGEAVSPPGVRRGSRVGWTRPPPALTAPPPRSQRVRRRPTALPERRHVRAEPALRLPAGLHRRALRAAPLRPRRPRRPGLRPRSWGRPAPRRPARLPAAAGARRPPGLLSPPRTRDRGGRGTHPVPGRREGCGRSCSQVLLSSPDSYSAPQPLPPPCTAPRRRRGRCGALAQGLHSGPSFP